MTGTVGRKRSMSALVVVGNQNGAIGMNFIFVFDHLPCKGSLCTSIGKSYTLWETFEGATRPRKRPLWPSCNSRLGKYMCKLYMVMVRP